MFKSLAPSSLEEAEKLEQLRLMQAGAKYKCVEVDLNMISIDTQEDLNRINEMLE